MRVETSALFMFWPKLMGFGPWFPMLIIPSTLWNRKKGWIIHEGWWRLVAINSYSPCFRRDPNVWLKTMDSLMWYYRLWWKKLNFHCGYELFTWRARLEALQSPAAPHWGGEKVKTGGQAQWHERQNAECFEIITALLLLYNWTYWWISIVNDSWNLLVICAWKWLKHDETILQTPSRYQLA